MKRILKKMKGNHNGPKNKATGNSEKMDSMMNMLSGAINTKATPKSSTKPPIRPNPNNASMGSYHTSGLPGKITSQESGISYDTTTGGIDEGNFGPVVRPQVPMRNLRPYVKATESASNYEKGEKFYIEEK